jgi:hypothetical protein
MLFTKITSNIIINIINIFEVITPSQFYFIDIKILMDSDQDLFVALLPSSVDHFCCSLCPGVVPNHPA